MAAFLRSADPEDIIAGLYEAVALPDRWSMALASVAAFTAGRTSHIFDWNPATGSGGWGAVGWVPGAGIDPAADDVYRDHYAAIDPRRPLFQSTIGTVWNCAEAMRDDAVPGARELYNDFLVPNGVRWTMCMTVRLADSRLITLASLRSVAEGAFGSEEKRRLAYTAPHISHIYRLRNLLGAAQSAGRLALAAFDHAARGIIMCDAAGRILYANPAATHAATGGGLSLSGGHVSADHSGVAALLAGHIRAAASPTAGATCGRGQAIRVPRELGRGDLFVLIAPMPAEVMPDGTPAAPAALLFIAIGTPNRPPLGRHLMQWFGLTAAEARLAADLLRGDSISEIAASRSVRVSTLRTQLKQILAKTGTSRQSELLALLSRLPAAPSVEH